MDFRDLIDGFMHITELRRQQRATQYRRDALGELFSQIFDLHDDGGQYPRPGSGAGGGSSARAETPSPSDGNYTATTSMARDFGQSTTSRGSGVGSYSAVRAPSPSSTYRDYTATSDDASRFGQSTSRASVVSSGSAAITYQGNDTEEIREVRRIVESRKQQPITPFNADEWERLLRQLQLSDKYPTLVQSFRRGFDVGIRPITKTVMPPNSKTIVDNPDAYDEIMGKEFSTGRYLGPYTANVVQAVLGPFQSSPLSLIPKSTRGKFRAIHNFSYPYGIRRTHPSINQNIDPDQYPCTYGTFDIICHIIFHLPPGSEASTRDIAEAYRTIPVIPSQWPGLVVRLKGIDSFAINTNNNFGLSSAGGVFGQVADASADIFRASGVGPVSKWVDDYIFFRIPRERIDSYNIRRREWRGEIQRNGGQARQNGRLYFRGDTMPNDQVPEFDEDMSFSMRDCSRQSPRSPHDSLFSYSDEDIDQISEPLGIPWEHTKTTHFRPIVKYIGFMWDLNSRTVSLPEEKVQELVREICEFQEILETCSLEDLQKLHGKLNWATAVIQVGHAYMRGMETMISALSADPVTSRGPVEEVAEELEWWLSSLFQGIEREIFDPYNVVDMEAYSDASSEVGIGITIGRYWRAWRLLPGWNADQRDIGWAEAVGFEFLVHSLCTMFTPGMHVIIHGDNQGVLGGWRNGKSRNKPTNVVFRRIHDIVTAHRCAFVMRYVPSKQNPADGPSRGVYPPIEYLLPRISIPRELRNFVVDSH